MSYLKIPCPVRDAQAFRKDEVAVIKAQENGRWHLSISCVDRYPTWDEICDVRYTLLPDNMQVAMMLPPKEEYVNIHNNCFHLWEISEEFPVCK